MGIEVMLAAAALAVGTYSAVEASSARSDQKRTQEKLQGEQKAQNAASAAAERRKQVREERVKRARILQSSEGTGAAGSSGEYGSLGALGTNLANNIGTNLGAIAAGDRMSDLSQSAANSAIDAQNYDALFGLSTSIFNAAGGLNAFKSPSNLSSLPSTNVGSSGGVTSVSTSGT